MSEPVEGPGAPLLGRSRTVPGGYRRLVGAHRAHGPGGPSRGYLFTVALLAGTASMPILAAISAGSATIGSTALPDNSTPFIPTPSVGPVVIPATGQPGVSPSRTFTIRPTVAGTPPPLLPAARIPPGPSDPGSARRPQPAASAPASSPGPTRVAASPTPSPRPSPMPSWSESPGPDRSPGPSRPPVVPVPHPSPTPAAGRLLQRPPASPAPILGPIPTSPFVLPSPSPQRPVPGTEGRGAGTAPASAAGWSPVGLGDDSLIRLVVGVVYAALG
ncbi:hypothetical protein [Micromonospora rhizosphaerae]|uniref:hypothetical protein n=1 Tax=Micromonospora rhizosphaerae TaxID=568872 RepID=UPI000A960523|nr:hypothetical protein [Micromonospora rhizosphaerae]